MEEEVSNLQSEIKKMKNFEKDLNELSLVNEVKLLNEYNSYLKMESECSYFEINIV